MKLEHDVRKQIFRNLRLSVLIYALPLVLMFAWFAWTGDRPWLQYQGIAPAPVRHGWMAYWHIDNYGFILFTIGLGIVEALAGMYDRHEWRGNERTLDIVCFVLPRVVMPPITALFTLHALPAVFPGMRNTFGWVPFVWAVLIICIADDLTQYWYHRLHHQLPWLWRFHRTHHSASYMGMAMASRQNILYTIFFSQIYLTSALVYVGLAKAAITVQVVKSTITLLAHSSLAWDKPFYKYRVLSPLAWLLERTISTPATHHAHHAATTDDGVGYYKGNFGNMFFLWDVIFGTAHISRQYPARYGISHYEGDEWYAQIFWPIVKSSVPNSELAKNGPMVRVDVPRPSNSAPFTPAGLKAFEPISNDETGRYESVNAL